MKVLWIVLGVLVGLCLLCAGGGYLLFRTGMNAMDDAGKFGDDSFRSIATSWDLAALESRAAPEIAEQNGPDTLPKLVATLKEKLGPMKEFTSSLTGLRASSNNGVSATYADWKADARFEKGSGTVTMELIKRNDRWQILKFNVESDALRAKSE